MEGRCWGIWLLAQGFKEASPRWGFRTGRGPVDTGGRTSKQTEEFQLSVLVIQEGSEWEVPPLSRLPGRFPRQRRLVHKLRLLLQNAVRMPPGPASYRV